MQFLCQFNIIQIKFWTSNEYKFTFENFVIFDDWLEITKSPVSNFMNVLYIIYKYTIFNLNIHFTFKDSFWDISSILIRDLCVQNEKPLRTFFPLIKTAINIFLLFSIVIVKSKKVQIDWAKFCHNKVENQIHVLLLQKGFFESAAKRRKKRLILW